VRSSYYLSGDRARTGLSENNASK